MAKQIKQFRYYDDNVSNNNNYPSGIAKNKLTSGSAFFNDPSLIAITQLGIQTLPGVKFYLNSSVDPIIIGSTGIYELDLEGISEITALSFDGRSIDLIANNSGAYLIVDAIYEEGDES